MEADVSRIAVRQDQGLLIRVQVQPKSRRCGLTGVHDDRLRLCVTEPPDKGKANAGVVKLLAELLQVPRSSLEILRGDTSRQKDVLLCTNNPAGIVARLAQLIAPL